MINNAGQGGGRRAMSTRHKTKRFSCTAACSSSTSMCNIHRVRLGCTALRRRRGFKMDLTFGIAQELIHSIIEVNISK